MDDALLRAVADRFGTPTYVYDLDGIAADVGAFRRAVPDALLRYAVKANANGDVLRALAELGVGAEVITQGELARALRAGVPADAVLVGGPAQGDELMRAARAAHVGLVSLDSAGQWQAWQEALRDTPSSTRFLVRLNPALDPRTHPHLATGAASSKFGLPLEAAAELAERVARAGALAGFHVHAGSMIRDLAVLDRVVEILAPLYRRIEGLELVDLGGGFAVPGFQVATLGERVSAAALRLGAPVLLEPGRWLVAAAGVLLTRVLHVKDGEPNHVIADAGMADLVRPALYGAEHPIRVLGRSDGPLRAFDIDGPLCENADRLGRGRLLPEPVHGDVLVVEEAGAYGLGMASNYASSLRPAEVVVSGGAFRLSRRRETVEDLWRLEQPAAPDATLPS